MKKKIALLLSAVLVVTMLLAGCGGGDAEEPEVIKLGWIGSLTGDQAPWGKCESQMLQLLVDKQNEDGGILGKQIELVKYDTRGDANEAVNAVKRLTSQDKVIAILGPNASAQALSIKAALNDAKVPDIATVATNPKITVNDDGSVNEYNFRVCFIDPYQGAVVGGYAAEKLNYKKAAILYDVASDYSQGFSQYFEETFTAMGGKVVAKEGFKAGDVDFRPQLSKIKAANPDVIIMPYYYKEVALSSKQARELGIKATLMGGDGWPSDDLFKMAGDALEGSYICNHFDPSDPDVKPVTELYQSKYNTAVEINAYLVNDAFLMFKAALEKAGTISGEAVAAALTQVEVDGVTGHIKLGEDTHDPVGKEAAMLTVKDKKMTFVEKYAVEL